MQTENKMGSMPEGRLLFTMALPMILSVLVQSLYNLVDSIFVGQLGAKALTAISLATPIATILLSLAFGISIGVNALLSQHLGAKNNQAASKVAGQGISLEVILAVLFVFFGLFGAGPFIAFQTSDATIVEMGTSYTSIISIFAVGLIMQTLAERLLASTGRTNGSMIILAVGALVNIVLDPIMIFGWGPIPAMGIAGAAWATIIAQLIAATVGMSLHFIWNKAELSFSPSDLKVDTTSVAILKIALPSSLTFALSSFLSFFMNLILIGFSTVAPAVYIIYVRILNFVLMPVYGIRNTLVSIVAYNYGANLKDRIRRVNRLALVTSEIIMVVGALIFLLLPTQLLQIFGADEAMLAIGIPALRIIGCGLIFTAPWNIFAGIFQALGLSNRALVVSIVQIVVTVGGAWLLAQTGQLTMVWWAFPLAEVAMTVTAVSLMRRVKKEHLN